MNISLLHRVLFTLILSGIMSASMSYLVSSFYCTPSIDTILPIWCRTWITAFCIIFIISPFLHKFVYFFVKNYK